MQLYLRPQLYIMLKSKILKKCSLGTQKLKSTKLQKKNMTREDRSYLPGCWDGRVKVWGGRRLVHAPGCCCGRDRLGMLRQTAGGARTTHSLGLTQRKKGNNNNNNNNGGQQQQERLGCTRCNRDAVNALALAGPCTDTVSRRRETRLRVPSPTLALT